MNFDKVDKTVELGFSVLAITLVIVVVSPILLVLWTVGKITQLFGCSDIDMGYFDD